MDRNYISQLHCPLCGFQLCVETEIGPEEHSLKDGIVACACSRYPVIEGILVLKIPDGEALRRAVRALKRGRKAEALFSLLQKQSLFSRAVIAADTRGIPFSGIAKEALVCFKEKRTQRRLSNHSLRNAVRYFYPNEYGRYFLYRFTSTSFIASLPLLVPLEDYAGSILEIGCGMGHHAYLIKQLYPHLEQVLLDYSFENLLCAKTFCSPQAECICLDANDPLPFKDRSFSAIFSSDAFHYYSHKILLFQEIRRVAQERSILLLSHLHNAVQYNPAPGMPLGSKQWLSIIGFPRKWCLAEEKIFKDFLGSDALELSESALPDETANAFYIVGTSGDSLPSTYTNVSAFVFPENAPVMLNPLFRSITKKGRHFLVKRWPSAHQRKENRLIDSYLPDSLPLEEAVAKAIQDNDCMRLPPKVKKDLRRKHILVEL